MIPASRKDKSLVIDILARSFDDNRSVNYILPQDGRRQQRIRHLMDYSFEVCYRYGKVHLSNDKRACALVLLPDRQKTTPATVLLDVKLILRAVGLSRLRRTLHRENAIEKLRPKQPLYYLWFIGVVPEAQGKGVGRTLLGELAAEAARERRTLCLETSTPQNVPWYQKAGFTKYNELDLGYTIHFLQHPPAPVCPTPSTHSGT